jgi:hypothetical protein
MTDAFEHQNRFRRGPEFFGACTICGERAGYKIEEELAFDDVHQLDRVHPLTAELCSVCFRRIFMNYEGKRSSQGLVAAERVWAGSYPPPAHPTEPSPPPVFDVPATVPLAVQDALGRINALSEGASERLARRIAAYDPEPDEP